MKSFNDDLDGGDYDDDYDDDNDFFGGTFGGTPRSQYFAIAKTANQNVVEEELDSLFRRFAVAEKILEEKGLAEEHERLLTEMVIDKELDDRTGSLYIELMGNIVTKCE